MKIVVMDYSVGEVHIFEYNEKETDETDIFAFLDNYCNDQGKPFKPSQIDWMIVDLGPSSTLPLHMH